MPSLDIPAELREELWTHQKDAIKFAFKRLRGTPSETASLVRMPTGTGKTGVIGVLSVAVPPNGWTLVLTPWKHLCAQMIDDLRERFWEARGWSPDTKPRIDRLYPSTLPDILQKTSAHWILVATFATLVSIFKKQRKEYDKLAAKLAQPRGP
jgi:superfamily II DNA or RNA helicase